MRELWMVRAQLYGGTVVEKHNLSENRVVSVVEEMCNRAGGRVSNGGTSVDGAALTVRCAHGMVSVAPEEIPATV